MTLFADVPMTQYVADSFGDHPPSLSASVAHLLLTRSPAHARHAHPRISPAYRQKEDDRFDLGSAAHAVLLEGRDDVIEVCDFKDWKTNAAKAARDTARAAGKIPLLPDQTSTVASVVLSAKQALRSCPDLVGYSADDMLAEQTALWQEGDAYCRCRPDWMAPDRSLVISFKTTANAEPDAFTRQALNLGYVLQAAFECRAIECAAGVKPTYVWLCTETDPPHASSLIGLSPAMADLGMRQFRAAVALWSECMTTGEWPGYPARIAYVDPPEWAVGQWTERENAMANAGEEVSAL